MTESGTHSLSWLREFTEIFTGVPDLVLQPVAQESETFRPTFGEEFPKPVEISLSS